MLTIIKRLFSLHTIKLSAVKFPEGLFSIRKTLDRARLQRVPGCLISVF